MTDVRRNATPVRRGSHAVAQSTNGSRRAFDRAGREPGRRVSTQPDQTTLGTDRWLSTMPWPGQLPYRPPSPVSHLSGRQMRWAGTSEMLSSSCPPVSSTHAPSRCRPRHTPIRPEFQADLGGCPKLLRARIGRGSRFVARVSVTGVTPLPTSRRRSSSVWTLIQAMRSVQSDYENRRASPISRVLEPVSSVRLLRRAPVRFGS